MERTLLAFVLVAGSLWAVSPFAGRWQGKLSGSIVFYLIRKDDKGTRVAGDANCELLQVAAQGKRMTFEVKHHVRHDSPEYGPNVKFVFELTGENEGMLRNLAEGPSLRMLREP